MTGSINLLNYGIQCNATTPISSELSYYRPVRVSNIMPKDEEGNNGDIWISNKLKVDELLDREDIDALANAENNGDAQHFKSEDFNKDFLNDLQEDLIILKSLREMWSTLKNDCKLSL